MFSRYRRTPPSSANSPYANKRKGNKNNNNQNPIVALAELRSALNRLDELTENFQDIGSELLTALSEGANRESKDANTAADAAVEENEVSSGTNSSENKATEKEVTYRRSPSATANDLLLESNAHFLSVSEKDEEEMVELIRRVAELVVLSERMAGQILEGSPNQRDDSASNSKGGDPNKDDTDEKSNNSEDAMPYLALFELFCERNALANIVNIVTGVAFAPKEKRQSRPGSSNSLDKMQLNRGSETSQTPHILPPLTIATQGIQSVSILIQNCSRATSLYFLLSNNRVNDLIGLPIHLYKRAEMNHTHYLRFARRGSRRPSSYSGLPLPVPPTSNSLTNYASNEIGELTTHFVSFLKSLAMRVNPETLQFFLTFPAIEDSNESDGEMSEKQTLNDEGSLSQPMCINGEEHSGDKVPVIDTENSADDEDTMSEHLVSKLIRMESETKEMDVAEALHSANDTSLATTVTEEPSSSLGDAVLSSTRSNPATETEPQPEVEFPLYARALEFCSSEQDSFVRLTAMNICMNMIRLATVQHDSVENGMNIDSDERLDNLNVNELNGHNSNPQNPVSLPTITPSGMLHEAPSLPMQDRVAIAKYACDPRRVSDLVSPLCARLTSQFGQVEGTVRNLQELANVTIPKHLQVSKAERKTRLKNSIHDLVANLQDELLMFDDLLRVGLVSLNEQAIEMLLATFVYPMLLQPLLLPLHRVPSANAEEKEKEDGKSVSSSNQNSSNDSKPAIDLQSPPPFVVNAIDTTCEDINEDNIQASSSDFPPSQSKLLKTYSSENMDLAPSKTALFGVSVVFQSISNPCLKHLVLAALLNQYSPPASGGSVIQIQPRITFSGNYRNHTSDTIRMERNHHFESDSDLTSSHLYNFGMSLHQHGENTDENQSSSDNLCTFILAPALIETLSKLTDSRMNIEETMDRINPYRNILLSYISGSGEMVALQKLATIAMHDSISGVDYKILRENVMSPNGARLDSKSILYYLCQSVVNKSVTLDGWWKVSFNRIAAKTLLTVIKADRLYLSCVYDAITKMRLEAANFLLSLPSRLDEKSRVTSTKTNGKSNSVDKQHLETWLLDRFYFDQPNKSSRSVVENICSLDGGHCGIEVIGTQSVKDASDLLCEDSRLIENMLVSETKGNTPFHCAATWALACLSLDGFCMKLYELKMSIVSQSEQEMAELSRSGSDDTTLSGDVIAYMSPKLAVALQDKSDNLEDSPKKSNITPEHGSIVGLVGKAAFPCVCEVTPTFASLFTGRTCVSNEGVQWQSLYLVVIGKYVVLAEPERSGIGGEGRVITTCKLSCLAAKKDTTVLANNSTPAKRLLLQHSSIDPKPPALFVIESSSSDKKPSYGPERLSLTRSRVDLWFEDSNACFVAWKALAGKIAKARAKRGSKIKAALLEVESCLPPQQAETKASF